jgi:DNA-binding response OmpR family regulator
MLGCVLIIDDEASLRSTLARILQNAGYKTIEAADGASVNSISTLCDTDLVLLDIHLPDIDGIELLRRLRLQCPKLPVVMLTGHGSLASAVEALRLGALDYLQKPVDPEILIARVRVVIEEQRIERRMEYLRSQISLFQVELKNLELSGIDLHEEHRNEARTENRFLKIGRLILDIQARRATFGDTVLNLPPSSFDYLCVLAKHSPETVGHQKLVTEAQGYQVSSAEARELAKWHIHVLRNALKEDPQSPRYLVTVRGVGYRLILD